MDQIVCSLCKLNKAYTEYYFRNDAEGYRKDCKSCCKKRSAIGRKVNPYYKTYKRTDFSKQAKKKSDAKYFIKNRQKIAEAQKKYNLKNREHLLRYFKEYYIRNKQKISQYHQKNKEKILRRHDEWRKNNKEHIKKYAINYRNTKGKDIYKRQYSIPKYRINKAMSVGIRLSLLGGKAGRRWEKLVGYSIFDLMNHLKIKFRDGMTWDNYGNHWHIDHKKPKSSFSFTSYEDEDFKRCWALKNLQPLLVMENILKSSKIIEYQD